MTVVRTAVDKATRALFDQVESLVRVRGFSAYEPFIREINAVTERYKNIPSKPASVKPAKINCRTGMRTSIA